MSRSTSGILFVDTFTPTGVEGEYLFENAKYSSQTDIDGNGAYDLQVGFTLHCYATDMLTFTVIPGVISRYLITEIVISDSSTVSGKIIWNMPSQILDYPTNSSYCMVSQTTTNKKISLPAPDVLYPELQPGFTQAVIVNDISDIIDVQNPSTGSELRIVERINVSVNGKNSFILSHVAVNPQNCILSVNGLIYRYGMDGDYFINSNILMWTDLSLVLETSDIMTISYSYV